jgi:hypothetical protein
MFVLAGVVLPVLYPCAPPGADQRAVQQDHPATLSGNLLQSPVQALGAGGQQADDFSDPPCHGGAVRSPLGCGQEPEPYWRPARVNRVFA